MALDLDQIRALADRVAASHGLEVVEIEYAGGGGKYRTLRVYIEKNAEERAKLLTQAKGRETPHAHFEDVEDAEFADEPGFDEGDEEGEEVEPEDEDDSEYDHDAFLRSLPSVDNPEHLSGITHGDCEEFSRDFGTVLDVEELGPGTEYLLEVSSPGLDRRLQKAEDFRRFSGSLVKLQTFEPVAGNRHWQGRLLGMEDGVLTLAPPADKKQKKGKKTPVTGLQPVSISISNVEKAHLVPEF